MESGAAAQASERDRAAAGELTAGAKPPPEDLEIVSFVFISRVGMQQRSVVDGRLSYEVESTRY